MMWSKFNMLFSIDSTFLLYNSLSNSFAELDLDTYNCLCSVDKNGDISILEDDLVKDLRLIKAIVDDDSLEIQKIKYITLRKRFANDSLQLTINPTLSCNFNCPYCFEKNNDPDMMSEEVEDQIVDFIIKSSKQNVNVVWFGGEPLIGFNNIKQLTEKILKLNVKLNATIITNGYLLTENIIKQLEALKIHSMQITLDGIADIQDSRRVLKNGGKTFNVIMSNIITTTRLSPNTQINIRVNLDKTNIDSFVQLYEYIMRLDNPKIRLAPAFVNDSTEIRRNPCVCDESEQISFLTKFYKETGKQAYPFYPNSIRSECSIRNRNSIVIGPKGELYKCWQDVGDSDRVYGNISGMVRNEKLLLEYLMGADPLDDAECNDCILFPICAGGCPYERIRASKQKDISKPCPLIKNNLQEFLILHYKDRKKNA